MNRQQEIEHLEFLSRRMTFMNARGSQKSDYRKIKTKLEEILDNVKGDNNG